MKESVLSFETKKNTTLVYLHSNCLQVLKLRLPRYILFWQFRYMIIRTEFSCLWCGYQEQMNMFLILSESSSLIKFRFCKIHICYLHEGKSL